MVSRTYEPFVEKEEALAFLCMKKSRLEELIAYAKTGKDKMPIPYYQDCKGGKLTFIISELKLWRWNRTNEIKQCTKAQSRMRIVG